MRETSRAYFSQSFEYVWICLNKVQNMHKLLLSSVMNISNCARILNMPESANLYANVGWICLKHNMRKWDGILNNFESA